MLYFNTNQRHFFFFWQNTSCIRKPQVISGGGGRTPCIWLALLGHLLFSELASPGKSIVSSYIGLCFLKQEPSVTNGNTGKKTQSSHWKAERASFFETFFKQSNGRNTLTGHHLPKRLGNLYPIIIILLAR